MVSDEVRGVEMSRTPFSVVVEVEVGFEVEVGVDVGDCGPTSIFCSGRVFAADTGSKEAVPFGADVV